MHNLNPLGIGTERLEAALQKHFPNHRIVRIDSDTTRKKGSLKDTLATVEEGKADILIGTQMIAKGHHFPNLTLVGILDIDGALFSVDFRSLERMGQLITQVAGRAGRATRLGTVLLQSCHPTHPLLTLLLEKGYAAFSDKLLHERKSAKLPPFSHQVLIRADAKKNEHGLAFLNTLKTAMQQYTLPNLNIEGPTRAPMERRKGFHRAQLLLQSSNRMHLHKHLKALLERREHADLLALSKTVRWSIDVDPLDMY
jgi:primosomal protein N' (replication factor Y) (superfamily II helicase)